MTNVSYTTLDTVLYDLSLLLDEHQYNEAKLREWALKGLRKLRNPALYSNKTCLLEIHQHKSLLPQDMKYLLQVAYLPKIGINSAIEELQQMMNLDEAKDNLALSYVQDKTSLPFKVLPTLSHNWTAMRMSTSSFIKAIGLDGGPYTNLYDCPTCNHEFTVDADNCITTTASSGFILVSYLAYAQDAKSSSVLIPDDEDLKEAIQHFCLFNYWMSKSMHKEEHSFREREWHLQRFQVLAQKVAGKNVGLHELENLKNMHLNLHQRTNAFDNFFEDINKPTT